MNSVSLPRLCEESLTAARASSAGRSATTVFGGHEHDMRQTLIALAAGSKLHEHESPSEATLQVLSGDVRMHTGEEHWDGTAGDYLIIPLERHDLEAVTDAVVLLTVATRA